MVLDLESEDGRIVVGLASIGAMVVGFTSEHEERANAELPAAVLAFQGRFHYNAVADVLQRIVNDLLKHN